MDTELVRLRKKSASLLAQKKKLSDAEAAHKKEAVEMILSTMKEFSISFADLGCANCVKVRKAPVKYRDEHGNEWSGRGLTPLVFRRPDLAMLRV